MTAKAVKHLLAIHTESIQSNNFSEMSAIASLLHLHKKMQFNREKSNGTERKFFAIHTQYPQ